MNTNDIRQKEDVTITIPAAIAAMPDLNLLERAVLAKLDKFPGCSNAGLSKVTGLSVRGIQALLDRLLQRGLVRRTGEGRAREYHLTFEVESRNKCAIQSTAESHNKCVVAAPRQTLEEFCTGHFLIFDNCIEFGLFADARLQVEAMRERVEAEAALPTERKALFINTLCSLENRCFAMEAMSKKNLPRRQLHEVFQRVFNADPAKLALFRQKVEAGQLSAGVINVLAITNG